MWYSQPSRLQKNYSKKGAKVPKQHVNEHNVICMSKFKYSIYLQSYAWEIEFKSSPKAESLKMTSRLTYFVNTWDTNRNTRVLEAIAGYWISLKSRPSQVQRPLEGYF